MELFAVIGGAEYEDSAEFKANKLKVWEAAKSDGEIDFSHLPPNQYKYFCELYFLYNRLAHSDISKETAKEQERKLYKDFSAEEDCRVDYLAMSRIIQDNIRRAGQLQEEVNKAETADKKLDKALQLCAALLNDESFYKRNQL